MQTDGKCDRRRPISPSAQSTIFAAIATTLFVGWHIATWLSRDLPLREIIAQGLVQAALTFFLMRLFWGSWLQSRQMTPPRARYVLRQLGWAVLIVACAAGLAVLDSALLTG